MTRLRITTLLTLGAVGLLAPGVDADPPDRVALAAPDPNAYVPVFEAPPWPAATARRSIKARDHLAPVWSARAGSRKRVLGRLAEDSVLPATRTSRRCRDHGRRGRWYKVDGGYVCVGRRIVALGPRPPRRDDDRLRPRSDEAFPHVYKKVAPTDAVLWNKLPSPRALRFVARAPDHAVRQLPWADETTDGAYWLSLTDETRTVGDVVLQKTVAGQWVRAEYEDKTMPLFFGVALAGPDVLPLAFVHVEEGAPVYCPAAGGGLSPCGTAEKHARFSIDDEVTLDGAAYVTTRDGRFVPRDRVRVARARPLPRAKFKGDKWVHFNLDEQTFVAYEGRTPVYASLISSGIERFATPTGTYRVRRKYLTKTMVGPDPDVGRYHIEDVPWTMYYKGGFAVHGAYWHNIFGNVRSHGCTNLAPRDARWLYHWSTPEVPAGWHGMVGRPGTWFYFTRDT